MSTYQNEIAELARLREENGAPWDGISPESAARMRLQNRFRTGLDIARYTADIMRRDMAEYETALARVLRAVRAADRGQGLG